MLEIISLISFIVFVIYWHYIMELVDIVILKSTIKGMPRFLVALLAGVAFYCAYFVADFHLFFLYFVIFLLYNIIYAFVYQNSYLRIFLCSSACIMHVIAFHAVITGVYSLFVNMDFSFAALSVYGKQFILSIVFVIIAFVAFFLVHIVPRRYMNLHVLKDTQVFILGALAALFSIFLAYNLYIYLYIMPMGDIYISITEIITPIIFISVYFLVLVTIILSSSKVEYEKMIDTLSTQVEEESIIRDMMLNDGMLAYEVSCETGRMREVFNKTSTYIGPDVHYRDYVPQVARDLIHPDDMHAFLSHFNLAYLISVYNQGKKEFSLEYRRVTENGYLWAVAQTTTWKDKATNEIKALIYVRDVNEIKTQQMALQFKAERDPLSGLYNKEMTQKLIETQLVPDGQGALMIIDVDNFKLINDTFGHAYGDMVICDVSKKITKTFRDNDIVGRIGGDEFIVYMKNTANVEIMTIKAKQLCEAIHTVYSSNSDDTVTVTVSASIGISLFPSDGRLFQDLYKSADSALYESKKQGKNTFNFCQEEISDDFEPSKPSVIESHDPQLRGQSQNSPEYIFKVLYSSDDYMMGIQTVIEFIAKFYNFDRGYIYTLSEENKYDFEWKKDESISSYLAAVKGDNFAERSTVYSHVENLPIYVYKNLQSAPENAREHLEQMNVVSTVKLPIFFEEKFAAAIGFDTCHSEINFSKDELHKLATICNILATFFEMNYVKEKERKSLDVLTNVLDNLNSYTYIVDKNTFEVLYMNSKTTRLLTNFVEKVGLCYESFFGYYSPCPDCPIGKIGNNNKSENSFVHNRNINSWCEVQATNLVWENGKEVALLSAIDTDRYSPFFEEQNSGTLFE